MHPVLEKSMLSEEACLLKVEAPHVSRAEPGQFVMVQHEEFSELVPLSILSTFEKGFTCLVRAVGRSTLEILHEAQAFRYVAGPLGKPFPIRHYGNVVFYTYSWGVAPAINVAEALKVEGNKLYLFHLSEDFYLKSLTSDVFDYVSHLGEIKPLDVDLVVSVGSNQLSKELLTIYPEKPIISMVNVHMLDAVGLCLVCRVLVDGKQKLACSDGPWFYAHSVNWENLLNREKTYAEQERIALEEYKKMLRRKGLRGPEAL